MAVRVRYPGRLCLLGEHCDWAGGASLTVPLPMGIAVRGEPSDDGLVVHAELEGELLTGRWETGPGLPTPRRLAFAPAAAAALRDRGVPVVPARLQISGDLPAGRGFSSSAAVILATLDALARLSGVVLEATTLAELAYQVEHDRLGVACGRLDPLACAAGEPLFLHWRTVGPTASPTPRTHRLQPGARFHLVVACFPRPRDTAGILDTLRKAWDADLRDALQADRARRVCTALQTFGSEAEGAARALLAGDAVALGAAMDTAQAAYEDELADGFVALRAPALWRTCQALRRHGALGAKFTGAGGDGSVAALFRDAAGARAAVDLLDRDGLLSWYTPVGPEEAPPRATPHPAP